MILKTARFEKDTRYYQLTLLKDLLGDWVVMRVNGQIGSQLGGMRQKVLSTAEDAHNEFKKQHDYRVKSRQYHCVNIKNFERV